MSITVRLLYARSDTKHTTYGCQRPSQVKGVAHSPVATPNGHPATVSWASIMDDLQDEYDFSKAQRGPVAPSHPGKTRITIRIDDDILTWFREQAHAAGGGNY